MLHETPWMDGRIDGFFSIATLTHYKDRGSAMATGDKLPNITEKGENVESQSCHFDEAADASPGCS